MSDDSWWDSRETHMCRSDLHQKQWEKHMKLDIGAVLKCAMNLFSYILSVSGEFQSFLRVKQKTHSQQIDFHSPMLI